MKYQQLFENSRVKRTYSSTIDEVDPRLDNLFHSVQQTELNHNNDHDPNLEKIHEPTESPYYIALHTIL